MLKHKCVNCNKEITSVRAHRFDYQGADMYSSEPIILVPGHVPYINVDKDATLFQFDSYSEISDCIQCPKCGQFPFAGSIDIYEKADVVFGISSDKLLNGE